jgi:hypothetical protein
MPLRFAQNGSVKLVRRPGWGEFGLSSDLGDRLNCLARNGARAGARLVVCQPLPPVRSAPALLAPARASPLILCSRKDVARGKVASSNIHRPPRAERQLFRHLCTPTPTKTLRTPAASRKSAGPAPSLVTHTCTGPRVIGPHRNRPGKLGPYRTSEGCSAPALPSRNQTGHRPTAITPISSDRIGPRKAALRPHRQLGNRRAGSVARSSHLHRPSRYRPQLNHRGKVGPQRCAGGCSCARTGIPEVGRAASAITPASSGHPRLQRSSARTGIPEVGRAGSVARSSHLHRPSRYRPPPQSPRQALHIIESRKAALRPHRHLGIRRAGSVARSSHLHRPSRYRPPPQP